MNLLEFIAGMIIGAVLIFLVSSIFYAWEKSGLEDELKELEERSEQLQMFSDEINFLRERMVGMNIVEFCREYQKIKEKYEF